MANHFRYRGYARRTAITAAGIGLVAVVCMNFFKGDTGLMAQWRLEQEIAALERELQTVEAEKNRWEARVDSLDPDNIDLDMLAEQVRRVLFYTEADEVVIDLAGAERAFD